jgi:chorismate synthase
MMPLRFMTAGESHGPALVAILEGMPAGLPLDAALIDRDLARRQQGYGAGPRMKIEADRVQILGGLMDGQTVGAPIAIMIANKDHTKWKGKAIKPMTTPRPGHADLTGAIKYGLRDLRLALERSSARETAARVAVGAVCKYFLSQFGISIGGYVTAIGDVTADLGDMPYEQRFVLAEESEIRCPDAAASERMRACIEGVIHAKDTLGGVLETVALGLPAGLGSYAQWDRRLEARLGAVVLSVQAIKGVEIGPAFENARLQGTQVQDAISFRKSEGKGEREELLRPTNNAGGIEGGISNGQPIVLRAAMKPIATTLTPQLSVDLAVGQETRTHYERSDFCPVPRAVPILEAMVAFVLADALIEKIGGDSIAEMKPRFKTLRKARPEDLQMDDTPHTWWPE